MRINGRLFFFVLLLGGLAGGDAWAGAWMRVGEESYLGASVGFSHSNEYWDRERRLRRSDCSSRDLSLNLAYEYGYSYYYTLFGSTSIENDSCGGRQSQGIPEVTVGVRGRLNKFRNGRTWELSAIVPVQGDPDDADSPGKGVLGLRAGVFFMLDPDPYKHPRKNFEGWRWNTGLQITWWDAGEGYELQGSIGVKKPIVDTDWRFSAGLDGLYAFGAESDYDPNDPDRSVDKDEIGLKLGLSRSLDDHASFSIGLNHSLWGRNTSKSTGIRFSVSKVWD